MLDDGRLKLRLVLPLFFSVGAGALIVETTWMRFIRGVMGATAPAVSASLVALSLGALLGALLGARIAARTSSPLRAYALVQLSAVALSLLVEPTLSLVTGVVDGLDTTSTFALTLSRLLASLVATLPASTAIGVAFPLLIAATAGEATELGSKGSALYAADLLGAALGAGLTAFWLPALLGVGSAYLVGAALLTLPGLVALMLSRATERSDVRSSPPLAATWPPLDALLISAGSGFGVFAAQLLLHQAFGRVLDQSTFALGAVLVTTLLSLGLGALLVVALQARVTAAVLVTLSATAAAVGLAAFPLVFSGATDGLTYQLSVGAPDSYVPRMMALCALTAGPALVAAAVVLPGLFVLCGQRAEGDGRAAGRLAGGLLAANTLGAIAGSLTAPYLLLPALTLWPSFMVLSAVYLVIALTASRAPAARVLVSVAVLAAVALAAPWRVPQLRLARGDTLLHVRTSAQGMVAVVQRGRERLIQTDNHYALGGTTDRVHQERQGHVPLLLHPSPKRVAFIGTATGSSASAALAHGVERLVSVEIMPGVTAAARRYFARSNGGVFDDPRTHVVNDDARSFLRRRGERFDVIVADLFVPWRSETGALYSARHFAAARRRLAEGGLFCQWLPLYQLSPLEFRSIVATFLDVFPDAQLYRGDFYGAHAIVALIGGKGVKVDPSVASRRARMLSRKGVGDRWVTHPLGPYALHVGSLESLRERLASVPRNTDDYPVVELSAARNPARQAGRGDWTIAGPRFLEAIEHVRRDYRRVPVNAQRASLGGFALQVASVYWGTGRSEQSNQALAKASELLPPELLSAAPPDPTAADVWHTPPPPTR